MSTKKVIPSRVYPQREFPADTPITDMRVVRRAVVIALVAMSASRIAQLEKAGLFPMHFFIGNNTAAWWEADIRDFLLDRAANGKHRPAGALAPKPAPAPKRASKGARA